MTIRSIVFIILSYFLFISCNTSQNDSQNILFKVENDSYWRNIAGANYIFIINSSELLAQNIILDDYYKYDISVFDTLKGISQDRIQFNIFMREDNINYISSLPNDGKVILFLVNTYDGYGFNNYLTSYFIENSIILHTNLIEEIINNEISLQNNIIENKLYERFETNGRLYNRVDNYIRNISNEFSQNNSFRQLERLDEQGVPYIILLMENFRTLPARHIMLENKSINAFEKYRYYGPELIIDALAAILNQITGEHFGTIYNGEATEEIRINVLNGWRIYLYKIMQ